MKARISRVITYIIDVEVPDSLPKDKIIEYVMENDNLESLVNWDVADDSCYEVVSSDNDNSEYSNECEELQAYYRSINMTWEQFEIEAKKLEAQVKSGFFSK